MFDLTDIQNAAPLPYDTLEIGAHTASSGCHIYLTDKTGRKIGVIWGKAHEKAYTAALIIAAVSAFTSTQSQTPCSHAPIIGLDGKWICQRCHDHIDMAVAHTPAEGK